MLHPGIDVRQTVFNDGSGWVISGCRANIDLGVISIKMEIETKTAEDGAKGKHVDDEEEGTKNRTLWDTLSDSGKI